MSAPPRRWCRIALFAGAIGCLSGCHVDPGANPASTGCTKDAQCGPGKACYRGFCVAEAPPAPRCEDGQVAACYEGPPGTQGVGICKAGLHECRNGTFGSCLEQVLPLAAEIPCNGLDDDCNGVVDDGPVPPNDPQNCGACGRACVTGLSCCGTECVDTSQDANHCNACGHTCGAGLGCCSGECVSLDSKERCGSCGGACSPDQECCNRACVDTRTNRAHCGGCNAGCTDENQLCCNSSCADRSASRCLGCSADCERIGLLCCAPICIDRSSDPANCGGCGNACGARQRCCGGQCVPDDEGHCGGCSPCSPGRLCCDGVCRESGPARCHACSATCLPGQLCCDAAAGCVTPTEDRHCGSCDNDCTSTGQICSNHRCCPIGQHETNGQCCPEGQTACNGRCANTASDSRNCGECGRSCFLLACFGGSCVI